MLGITVPDAIAFGTLVLAILAAWRGSVAGAKAEKVVPPTPAAALLGGALVDSATLHDLVDAVENLTEAVRELVGHHRDRTESRMAELLEQISAKLDRPTEHYRRR